MTIDVYFFNLSKVLICPGLFNILKRLLLDSEGQILSSYYNYNAKLYFELTSPHTDFPTRFQIFLMWGLEEFVRKQISRSFLEFT